MRALSLELRPGLFGSWAVEAFVLQLSSTPTVYGLVLDPDVAESCQRRVGCVVWCDTVGSVFVCGMVCMVACCGWLCTCGCVVYGVCLVVQYVYDR